MQKKYVALQVENGETVAGYKGGFVPKASVGAVLFNKGILTESPVLERSDFHILLVEAEVAFRFCKSVTHPLADVAALRQAVCEVHPAIELPDAASPDFGMLRKNFPHLRKFLIATNVAASHVLLGPARDPNANRAVNKWVRPHSRFSAPVFFPVTYLFLLPIKRKQGALPVSQELSTTRRSSPSSF